MTDEQKAAYIMAQAAVLNATVAGMTAENEDRISRGLTIAFDEAAFVAVVNDSGCHHNTVVAFFGE